MVLFVFTFSEIDLFATSQLLNGFRSYHITPTFLGTLLLISSERFYVLDTGKLLMMQARSTSVPLVCLWLGCGIRTIYSRPRLPSSVHNSCNLYHMGSRLLSQRTQLLSLSMQHFSICNRGRHCRVDNYVH